MMKEYFNNDTIEITSVKPTFKTSMTSGSLSLQAQALDEGFHEITGGGFTVTGDGEVTLKEVTLKVVLTGDARFFMSSTSNRNAG